jgi:hypothetical protein
MEEIMDQKSLVRQSILFLSAASLLVLFSGIAHASTASGPRVVGNAGVYNYSPSVIQNGNVQQFWWCGEGQNPQNPTQTSDTIQYESINLSTGATVGPESVLGETPGGWDSVYTCNAQVVEGVFTNPLGNGTNYTYAMYYTGTAQANGTLNSIGVAFSNDGINWAKYPNPVISYNPNDTAYGVGQPAAYNANGAAAITVLYEDTYPTESHVEATSTDGIHFTTQGTITTNGLSQVQIAGQSSAGAVTWGNAAYDDVSGDWYAVYNMAGTRPPSTVGGVTERGGAGVIVYRIPATSLLTGSTPWQQVFTVDTNLTGYEANFISGFLRDIYGNVNVKNAYPDIEIYTSASIPQPAWDATPADRGNSGNTNQWNIAWELWTPNQLLVPFKRFYNNTVHEVTTGWIDPNGGFSLQSTLAYLYESPQGSSTLPLYGCVAGNDDYFVSPSSNCEGQIFLGIEGYVSSSSGSGLVPLYRCFTGTDHFVSLEANCEGYTTESLLGYANSQQ